MNYTEVCARAVELYNLTGYHDPEYARVIANHSLIGQPMAHGPFQANNFDHTIGEYPRLHRPLDGAPVDMLGFGNHSGLGLNNDHLGFEQSVPATPTRHAQTNVGSFTGQDSNTAGRMGYGSGIKQDFASPGAFNPGGRMSNPNEYRTPGKPKSSVDFSKPISHGKATFGVPHIEDNDLHIEPFGDFSDLKNFGTAGLGAGGGNSHGFNADTYSRHLAADETAIGNSPAASNVGNLMHTGSARKKSIPGPGNVGRFAGPSSSASANDVASPQDALMAGRSSPNAASSPTTVVTGKDADFDMYINTSDDGSSSDK